MTKLPNPPRTSLDRRDAREQHGINIAWFTLRMSSVVVFEWSWAKEKQEVGEVTKAKYAKEVPGCF